MAAHSLDRRQMLRMLAGLAPAATAFGSLAGCSGGGRPEAASGAAPPATLRVPLVRLPVGERVVVRMGERPVELVRGADGVRARSLWCSHMGCEVHWQASTRTYRCPCHEGVFDEDGEPVSGPPDRALRLLPVRLEGGDAVIGAPGSTT